MSILSKPKVPTVTAAPPPPTSGDDDVKKAVDKLRKRRKNAIGSEETILTSSTGDTSDTPGTKKTILGSS